MGWQKFGSGLGLGLPGTDPDVTHNCPDLDRTWIFSMRAEYMPDTIRARVFFGFSLPLLLKLAKKKIDKKG